METILLANIGNRSLIYKEKHVITKTVFIGDINEPSKSFREVTRLMSERQEKDYSDVKINILDSLLGDGKLKGTINSVYLFTSSQKGKDASRRQKDTEFAGLVIAELIKSEYNIPSVKTECLSGVSVIDSEKLIKWYRDFFQTLVKTLTKGDFKFIICDSGGTPQQKTSLKLVAEYFLDENSYDYYQIIEPAYKEGELVSESQVNKLIEKIEYSKIIKAKEVELLIEKGNYAAAASLLLDPNKYIVKALQYCSERLNGIESSIPTHGLKQDFPKTFSLPYSKYQDWKTIFSQDEYDFICESLSIACFYLDIKDWTRFVLATQNFTERFVNKFLLKHQTPYVSNPIVTPKCPSCNASLPNATPKCLCCNIKIDKCFLHLNSETAIEKKTLVDKLKCIKYVAGNGSIAKVVITYFGNCHSGVNGTNPRLGLDVLRNKIAHNGIGVNEIKKITDQVPDILRYFSYWKTAFGLPSTNVFITANEEINKVLKEQ